MASAVEKPKGGQRTQRPNYGRIHAKPLPLDVFPLPPLIPHNPLSLIHVAIAYVYQVVNRPVSQATNRVTGYFSTETNSVHITDARAVRLLWERGFFGKGALSRSEPTWLEREKKRLGLLAEDTSEEYTRKRREERRLMKLERARLQREVIDKGLEQEAINNKISKDDASEKQEVSMTDAAPEASIYLDTQETQTSATGEDKATKTDDVTLDDMRSESVETAVPATSSAQSMLRTGVEVVQQEYLQLTSEEAFFLHYGLGILTIRNLETKSPIDTLRLFRLFRAHSYCPPKDLADLSPYDPFLSSYAVYHHYRSLGWVVRPGIKFAVDWLLYLRGPAFSHAEFAVMVVPAYRDPYWRATPQRRLETEKRERKDWWWLHCLQRVQAQVRKGLVVCWVDIPSPSAIACGDGVSPAEAASAEAKGVVLEQYGLDIGKILKQYKVRDMVVKRWIPNRSRD